MKKNVLLVNQITYRENASQVHALHREPANKTSEGNLALKAAPKLAISTDLLMLILHAIPIPINVVTAKVTAIAL